MLKFRKTGGLRGLILAAAAVMSVSAATPAWADEKQALADQVISTMFDVLNFKSLIAKGMEQEAGGASAFPGRPEWNQLLLESMVEEVDQDMPAIKAIFSREFAKNFTVEELKAGVVIMSDPAIQKAMGAAAAGREPPANLRPGKEADRMARSPAGQRFLDKIGNTEALFEATGDDMVGEIVPGAFRRFADKAEAAEARRRPASASN